MKREHSSVGSERLPYKQRVGGSTPSAPTKERFRKLSRFFCTTVPEPPALCYQAASAAHRRTEFRRNAGRRCPMAAKTTSACPSGLSRSGWG